VLGHRPALVYDKTMSESATQRQKSSGTESTDYPKVLERETYDYVPQSWIDAGRDANPTDDDLVFEPVACCYERTLHRHARTATAADLAEHDTLVVRYENSETGATHDQSYLASKRGDTVLPACLRKGCPKFFESTVAIPRSEVVDE
jgi:hypothetical protein